MLEEFVEMLAVCKMTNVCYLVLQNHMVMWRRVGLTVEDHLE
jgi:hypothetical protein